MQNEQESENLEKFEKKKKSKWGGKRGNSGRKPLLGKEKLEEVKSLIAEHGSQIDPIKKKERVLVLLDTLYQLGVKGNPSAIKEYLDRQLGKSKQALVGDKDSDEIQLSFLERLHDAADAVKKERE